MRPTFPLETSRLLLRPFEQADAPAVEETLKDGRIARMLLDMPQAYPDGPAHDWIQSHVALAASGERYSAAIIHKATNTLIGGIGLSVTKKDANGELGFWIDPAWWSRGLGSEAAGAMRDYAFDGLRLHRLHARLVDVNRAAARVAEKIGMLYEGFQRQSRLQSGRFWTTASYAMLRCDPRITVERSNSQRRTGYSYGICV